MVDLPIYIPTFAFSEFYHSEKVKNLCIGIFQSVVKMLSGYCCLWKFYAIYIMPPLVQQAILSAQDIAIQ